MIELLLFFLSTLAWRFLPEESIECIDEDLNSLCLQGAILAGIFLGLWFIAPKDDDVHSCIGDCVLFVDVALLIYFSL
jgi:hypothetical protein